MPTSAAQPSVSLPNDMTRDGTDRPVADLPLAGTEDRKRWVGVPGVLIGLLVLVVAIGLAADHDAPAAGRRPRTVSITLAPATDPQHAVAQARELLALVRAQPGVAAAEPVTEHELGKLVEPWLGEGARPPGQPGPWMIEVTSISGNDMEPARLQRIFARSDLDARIDDITPIAEHAPGAGGFPQRLAVAGGGLLLAALVGAVVMIVRRSLQRHLGTVALLREMGAVDGYLARQLEHQAMVSGLRGGLAGFTVAMLSVLSCSAALRAWPGGSPGGLLLRPVDWVILAMVPVATAVVVTLVARLTARWGLRRMR